MWIKGFRELGCKKINKKYHNFCLEFIKKKILRVSTTDNGKQNLFHYSKTSEVYYIETPTKIFAAFEESMWGTYFYVIVNFMF